MTHAHPTPPTARAYLRVSSATQVENYSLAFKRDKALAWATYQDLGPVQMYEKRTLFSPHDGGLA